MEDALKTAKSCRHYAMCKIDFLGSGVCASGPAKHYVSYYPQGRMDLYAALAEGRIPVTEQCVAIADSCDLCGKCDYQCCFVTEMRPSTVMKALKNHVARHLVAEGTVERAREDRLLREMRAIVGAEWAANDRAIAATYAFDPCALAAAKMPAYVILPRTREEIAALLKLLKQHEIPWVVRANGTNVLGFHLCEGAVIDLNRMKDIVFDEKNWSVRIGPGVAAFDLQREAVRRGYRVNVAEPAALVCGSTMSSGILSLFSAAYGTSADNYVDAEFVAPDGACFSLNEKDAPNLFAFSKSGQQTPGICTALTVKLQPVTDDEAGVLVPFRTLAEALDFARECAVRRIGLAIGVLGAEYVSAFIAPTRQLAATAREVFEQTLGIAFMVLVIGDRYALHSITAMGQPVIDQRLFTALSLGLPALKSAPWLELVTGLAGDEPFSYLKIAGFTELAETALAPSPATLAQETAPELRGFYAQLYARPEMTNLVWLNMFRITSTRVGREKHFFPLLMYLPLDFSLIDALCAGFARIGESHRLKHEFGFVTPVDGGKRCIFEYDYYYDQNDGDDIARIQQATLAAGELIEEHSAREGTIRWLKYLLYQGYCRKENLLYA